MSDTTMKASNFLTGREEVRQMFAVLFKTLGFQLALSDLF